ncbi:hypothetical protein FACS189472_17810 [Alphaproteobacteria bacterium]|nr:hypothetical protein FACS189472_17810 [Alphaproteobacteria bacterium]
MDVSVFFDGFSAFGIDLGKDEEKKADEAFFLASLKGSGTQRAELVFFSFSEDEGDVLEVDFVNEEKADDVTDGLVNAVKDLETGDWDVNDLDAGNDLVAWDSADELDADDVTVLTVSRS